MRFLIVLALIASLTAGAGCARRGDDRKGVEDLLARAREHSSKDEHDEAIKALDEAVRLDPGNAHAFSSRGAVRFRMKEYDRAIADLDEAIRLDPGNPTSGYYIRGAAWYLKKEYAKGVKDLDEAIRLNPNDAEGLNSRAWAAATCPDAQYRDGAKALDYAKRACELDGWRNPFYWGTLAASLAENGEFADAVVWQRKALRDEGYLTACGEEGRRMLRLFEQGKPYRETADGGK